MKIGISTSVIERGKTGISRYVCSLVRAFLEQEGPHQFTLFVLAEDLPLFAFAQGRLEIVTVPEEYRAPLRNISWHQMVLPRLARRLRLDVLHIPSYRRMLWRKPCALVATIHDLAPFHVSHKYDWKRMIYGRYGARLLSWRQHEIIAISQNTARDISTFFGLPPGRVNVIYNGLDHDQFFPGDTSEAGAAVAKRFGLQAPYLLYVARLEHPGKNHLRLISAFEQFKAETQSPVQLVFAGKDWTGAEVIHAAALVSKCSADIRFLGFVDEADLPALYRAAEALVCPSLFEGFGLPLIEAMACGCPVLCSSSGSLAEIVGQAALIVDAEEVSRLKENLARILTDASLRLRLRELGLVHAQEFDWRKAANRTLDVYARALIKTRRARVEPASTLPPVRLAQQPR